VGRPQAHRPSIGEKDPRGEVAAAFHEHLAAAEKKRPRRGAHAYERDVANHSKGCGPKEAKRRMRADSSLGSARHVAQ